MNQRPLPGSDVPLHLNKPTGMVEEEEMEVERELPFEDNVPIKRIEPRERPDPPLFEDWEIPTLQASWVGASY